MPSFDKDAVLEEFYTAYTDKKASVMRIYLEEGTWYEVVFMEGLPTLKTENETVLLVRKAFDLKHGEKSEIGHIAPGKLDLQVRLEPISGRIMFHWMGDKTPGFTTWGSISHFSLLS